MNTVTLTKNAQEFMSAFDGCVDQFYTSGTKFDPLKLVRQFKLSNREIIAVQSKLNVEDLELLAIGADEQLVEGYSNISKSQQRELLTMYHVILEIPTAPTRERKEKTGASDVTKTPKPLKQPLVGQPEVVEHYGSVFAVASKYRCLRTFIGNVVISGSKITADQIQEYRYPKGQIPEGADLNSYTDDQFVEILKASKPIEGGSVTLIGKCIDSIHKF